MTSVLTLTDLFHILVEGQALWVLALGGFLCLLIDALWPKKLTMLVYLVGIFSLGFSLFVSMNQWWFSLEAKSQAAQSVFVLDRLTLFFIPMIVLSAIFTLLNALGYLGKNQKQASEFVALVLFSVLGMILLVAADHLILNFIGLETMSLAVYVLVGSQKKNLKSVEAAIKYFIMGGVASAIFLYGIAFFYGSFQTFRLTELALKVAPENLMYLKNLSLGLMLTGLFFKLGIVPFHFWTPDVYQGAPSPVTGFMATAVKIAAFGFLLRLLHELNVFNMKQIETLMSMLTVMTLVVGNLVAILQDDVKRMLAYSSISHAGFMLLGILAGYVDGNYAFQSADVVLYYLFGYTFMSLGAFAVLSLMVQEKHDATRFGDFVGLAKTHPVLAAVFSVFLLSMMGLPGTVGFTAKYGVVALAIQNGHLNLAIFAVLASVVSASYYLKPLGLMYFQKTTKPHVLLENPESIFLYVTLTFCLIAVIALGLMPDLYLPLAQLTLMK